MEPATSDSIRQRLHRFGMESSRLRAAVCRAAGIAESELDALEHLEEEGPLTQRELGERLLLTSGGVTVLVDRLERAGLVSRRPHPTDRRAVVVEPSSAVRVRTPAALNEFHATIERAASAVPVEHREVVASFLDAVSDTAAHTVESLTAGRFSGARRE
jgi:DNA-binding MarR family transcriptional regulator